MSLINYKILLFIMFNNNYATIDWSNNNQHININNKINNNQNIINESIKLKSEYFNATTYYYYEKENQIYGLVSGRKNIIALQKPDITVDNHLRELNNLPKSNPYSTFDWWPSGPLEPIKVYKKEESFEIKSNFVDDVKYSYYPEKNKIYGYTLYINGPVIPTPEKDKILRELNNLPLI